MSQIQSSYGTNGQTITVSLASLTNGSFRQSLAVDNTTNQFLDALVMLVVQMAGSGVSATGFVNVYAYGTVDAGSHYSDGCSGSDAAFTPTAPTNLRLIGTINTVANSTTYNGGPFSIAAAFGGLLPQKWGIVVENECGATLGGTEGNHLKLYQGVQASSI